MVPDPLRIEPAATSAGVVGVIATDRERDDLGDGPLPVADNDLFAGANLLEVLRETLSEIGDVGAPHWANSIWL